VGQSSFVVWSRKHCLSCFSPGHYKFVNLSVRHRTVSTGQFFFEFFFLLNTVRYLTDKFMNL
jgi:hypothetical protein